MKLKSILVLILLGGLAPTHAATAFYDGLYFVTSFNGGANVYNQVTSGATPGSGAAAGYNLTPDGTNPQFGSFGSFNLADNLTIKGFQYKTWNNDSSNVTYANLYYRIYQAGSPGGAFTDIQTNSPISSSGNNKTWEVTSGTTNLLSGLPTGNYTIELYTESYTNGVNSAGNIFGFSSNPTANFTVVPEPASATLGLLGMGLLLRRRRVS